jgi:transcriptional regulator with XRE-family HTH domain
MLSININTPHSVQILLKEKFKQKRLALELTQEGLSNKSGVSLRSLKRFESSGQISLESLLKLALILECLDDFINIANVQNDTINSLDELLQTNHQAIRKRGKIK